MTWHGKRDLPTPSEQVREALKPQPVAKRRADSTAPMDWMGSRVQISVSVTMRQKIWIKEQARIANMTDSLFLSTLLDGIMQGTAEIVESEEEG